MRIGIRSISAKFIVGFFLIFAVSFLLLSWTVTSIIQTSNQKIITDDLIGLKKTGNNYVRQAFLINHFANDDIYFAQIAEEMIGDLRYATSSEVGAYTVGGKLIQASETFAFADAAEDDLKQAVRGATAYTISYDGGTASVLYAYPVMIDGMKVGILRYSKPFDLLYEQSDRILSAVFYIALAIFAAAFLFSYLLSRHISIPLAKLAGASTEVMKGNLDVRLTMRRRDEIGRLADNFNEMIGQLKSQIGKIERDRDRLEKLHLQGKHFFDNVTHELKTPLTSILGYAELIRENGENDPAFFRKGMNHIVDESQRLHGMVVSLLETSKEQAGWEDSGRIEAGQLLRDVCDAMSFKAQRYKKTIRCESEAELYVEAQPDKLRQLFINLIDNAIKYSDPHSEISAKAEASATGCVRIVIANPSVPIAPERLAHIFEPFNGVEHSAREQGSVGLGLAIARSIADELSGLIRVASEAGETVVTVELPGMEAGRQG
ncbi:HAMP domain-containing sensor histidine kinase [Paenibacillus sp. LHD-117]|uniref:sensor histidine kinase n=1 Tax=Paenibacillus sp. LHD-117 TaxID=3071412 RepID=UPI0027E07F8A|nr:HAMP domain-containing sensor histidine kinase [Paenibacillus sp. LHD-117]MDQ6422895.1 HAMP domain-containing sensor histidine kinase [Paenibacillus sp. LHD-117]